MIPVLLFDDGLADLGPLSDLRASWEQRTGALSAAERWLLAGRLAGVLCAQGRQTAEAQRLARTVAALAGQHAATPPSQPHGGHAAAPAVNPRPHDAVLVNARFDVRAEDVDALHPGSSMRDPQGVLIAARRSGAELASVVTAVAAGSPLPEHTALRAATPAPPAHTTSWQRPWHLLDAAVYDQRLARDFELLTSCWQPSEHGTVPSWATHAGRGAVHVHATAQVGANVVLDTTGGPIVLDRECTVRHQAVIMGPAYVGPRSWVSEHALVKARSSIGPHCKVGGEVGSVIFQGCSNKVHDGHLGDALVGEWVNLGAGTVNSNLLNTYAEVVMRLRPSAPLERTGRQFMGCVIGDHSKLAIGTRIMTGTSIGTGTMWAASTPASGAVRAFTWATDDGERQYQADKFVATARLVMARRNVALDAPEEAQLRALLAAAP